jgi:hypothetical protein
MAKKPAKPKKKNQTELMAEYIYEFAYNDFMSKINGRDDEIWDSETLITKRAAAALEQWKKDGGKFLRADKEIIKAHEKWEAENKPGEGVVYKGERYKFKLNGEFDLAHSRMFAEHDEEEKPSH